MGTLAWASGVVSSLGSLVFYLHTVSGQYSHGRRRGKAKGGSERHPQGIHCRMEEDQREGGGGAEEAEGGSSCRGRRRGRGRGRGGGRGGGVNQILALRFAPALHSRNKHETHEIINKNKNQNKEK